MATYRVLGFSNSGRRVASQFVRCEDLNDVREHAQKMLRHRMVRRVEVWQDQNMVHAALKRGRPARER